jgi:hypothetical protein
VVVKSNELRRFGTGISGSQPQASGEIVNYPLCDAAVRDMAQSLWKLAEAILAECSEPGKNGVRNESELKMEAMRQEIARNHGVDLSLVRIRKLRTLASAFPPDRRRSGVSVEAHLEAGTPEALNEFEKAAPAGTTLTRSVIRKLKNSTEQTEQNAQKEERRRQVEDQREALQNLCKSLKRANEELRQRYAEACRSAGKEPEALSPPLAPKTESSITTAEDLEQGLSVLLVSCGIDPTMFKQAITAFITAVVARQS